MSGEPPMEAGAIICLMALYEFGGECDTIYEHVVGEFHLDDLVREARRSGNMRSSGLSAYLRLLKRRAEYRAAAPPSEHKGG